MMKAASKKDRILAAATELFTERGFDGTSMADIAEHADVNHSLIFHYFGNKEKLWVAVKQHIAQQAQQKVQTVPSTDLPFNEFLLELFKRSIAFYEDNPQIVRMINWQRLEPVKKHTIGVTDSPEMQKWIRALAVYQQRGDIPTTYKLEFVVIFMLSIASSIVLDPNVYIQSEHDKQEYINFCIRALLKMFSSTA